ncbi:hypothetical protein [Natronorubrum sp. DTA7]|uniref:hypothetical protein n=1 Tax=Natronorubrum sp. DTA7 TaxID=3447016 RepID=UPI003F82E064
MTDSDRQRLADGFFEELDTVVFGAGFAIAVAAVIAFGTQRSLFLRDEDELEVPNAIEVASNDSDSDSDSVPDTDDD